jgi:hypothetical protein
MQSPEGNYVDLSKYFYEISSDKGNHYIAFTETMF